MATAEEMPDMPGMNHDMSAMASHEDQDNGSQGMPCGGGHCFTHALPTETSLGFAPIFGVVAPVTFDPIEPLGVFYVPMPTSTAPPGQFIHVKTIVMRN